jgi:copper resistance protein C
VVAIPGTVGPRRAGSWGWALTALAATLLLSGALLMVGAAPAFAHENVLASSVPPASATVAEPPERVMLTFKWPIQPGSAVVTVVGPDGATQWQHGEAEVADRSIHVGLRPLEPAGRYEVRYQGVSGWGHPFQGKVSFTLAPPVAAAPATPASNGPVGSGGSGLPLVWVAGVVLLTAAAAAVGVRLGRTLQ